FLGTPAGNLVPVAADGGALRFNGTDLAPADLAAGLDKVQLLFRAQDITVGRREGKPSTKAKYIESAPIAGQSMVTAMVGELRLTAMVEGFFRARPGEEIDLSF